MDRALELTERQQKAYDEIDRMEGHHAMDLSWGVGGFFMLMFFVMIGGVFFVVSVIGWLMGMKVRLQVCEDCPEPGYSGSKKALPRPL